MITGRKPMFNMDSNLDIIYEISGGMDGAAMASADPNYMNELIANAHNAAADAFDEFAATYGLAGGISHMFEYGTAGVTPGPVTFDPIDRAAHLWVHRLESVGAAKEVSFSFRPAVKANPVPTTASTGVPSKYLRKLSRRKYVFSARAEVTEMGHEVKIAAKNGDFVFVPFMGEPTTGKYQNDRGYMMWNSSRFGPIKAVPGRTTAGNFTAIWRHWWSETGGEMMTGNVVTNYNKDFEEFMKQTELVAAKTMVKPVSATLNTAKKTSAIKRAAAIFKSRALKRRGRHRA